VGRLEHDGADAPREEFLREVAVSVPHDRHRVPRDDPGPLTKSVNGPFRLLPGIVRAMDRLPPETRNGERILGGGEHLVEPEIIDAKGNGEGGEVCRSD
jgi:hypothetical protein